MKKGMVNVLILALVLINLVLSVVLVFTFVPAINKTANLVDNICKIIDLDVDGKGQADDAVSVEDLEYVAVTFTDDSDSQVFNLKQGSDGTVHHIKLSVTLAINKNHEDYSTKMTSLTSAMTYISGQIGDIMLNYTEEEANSNKRAIEKDVLKMLKQLFDSDFIYDVSFTQFVIS